MFRIAIVALSLSLAVASCGNVAAQVPDINPLPDPLAPQTTLSSVPRPAVALGGIAVFAAFNGIAWGLWRTDGTPAGTRLLANVNPYDAPSELRVAGTRAFCFFGRMLWVTDGTVGGTRPVRPFVGTPATSSTAVLGEALVFSAAGDLGAGTELWRSDGTPDGTSIVKDLRPGHGNSSSPHSLIAVGDSVFFSAEDGIGVDALWRTDGTADGTTRVLPGQAASVSTRHGVAFRGLFYFVRGTNADTMWATDGTSAGTRQVVSFPAPVAGMVRTGDDRLFILTTAAVWTSDGTAGGTQMVSNAGMPAGGHVVARERDILFTATAPATGQELWRSDGTPGQTLLVKDIYPGVRGSNPLDVVGTGSRFVYAGAEDDQAGSELWCTDGTPNGTRLVVDMNPNVGGSTPYGLSLVGGRLYLIADDGRTGFEPRAVTIGASVSSVGRPYSTGLGEPTLGATDPVLGTTMMFYGHSAPMGISGYLLVSLGHPPATRVGARCFLHVAPAATVPLASFTSQSGRWRRAVPVPSSPALVGLPVAAQVIFAPTASPLGFDTTQGLHLALGL